MKLTLSIIKPDAVKRNLIGKINTMIEDKSIKIVGQKMIKLSLEDAQMFYSVHKDRAFYQDLCNYMISGPIVVQVLSGKDVIVKYRELMGATNPSESTPGSIRGDLATELDKNVVHGSDSDESAERELELFFG